jgi:hypothetical protein
MNVSDQCWQLFERSAAKLGAISRHISTVRLNLSLLFGLVDESFDAHTQVGGAD